MKDWIVIFIIYGLGFLFCCISMIGYFKSGMLMAIGVAGIVGWVSCITTIESLYKKSQGGHCTEDKLHEIVKFMLFK